MVCLYLCYHYGLIIVLRQMLLALSLIFYSDCGGKVPAVSGLYSGCKISRRAYFTPVSTGGKLF